MANPHPIKVVPKEEESFHPRDAVKSGIKGGLLGAGVGFVISAIQNSLAKQRVGVWGVFSRTGGSIAMFTAVGTVYTFAKDASANLREKDDTLNITIASFLSGATIGLRVGRIPAILGIGAAFSIVMSTFEYTGGTLRGARREAAEMDEYERKEWLRKNRRRPIEETIANIGEGRGIKPPGYEERRRERLKEKYGIEINPVSANA
ncbi:hypothetical protein GGS23DRAFT_596392 [Durotheca rogersii]|uniref:uncharacterized protein n=1 Tax=Durotheca rogersii TaxID=419775 RepID=UPI0022211965|nr:uncharacterized protein GGS23DRAFT_596392 [Durotheca rogersii]KAI5863903.1 hypothetical protein GGS23DRAFT_596392 [Durotheca rogersii]